MKKSQNLVLCSLRVRLEKIEILTFNNRNMAQNSEIKLNFRY
jgi:hypothetical protein